jgi:hypothetical protein
MHGLDTIALRIPYCHILHGDTMAITDTDTLCTCSLAFERQNCPVHTTALNHNILLPFHGKSGVHLENSLFQPDGIAILSHDQTGLDALADLRLSESALQNKG